MKYYRVKPQYDNNLKKAVNIINRMIDNRPPGGLLSLDLLRRMCYNCHVRRCRH